MPILHTVSGMRGTLGGTPQSGLTPQDIVQAITAYGLWLQQKYSTPDIGVLLGRDGRSSGEAIAQIASGTLQSLGIHVTDVGYTTTPSLSLAVMHKPVCGAIMVTASHNPERWNGLKFLRKESGVLSYTEAQQVWDKLPGLAHTSFACYPHWGSYQCAPLAFSTLKEHVQAILQLDIVRDTLHKVPALRIGIDGINSTGGILLQELVTSMGCTPVLLHKTLGVAFAHNPEPRAEHLGALQAAIREQNLDLGLAVDPDGDRLVLVDASAQVLGEEYTLLVAADYVLTRTPGPCVNNLSSSDGLYDLGKAYQVDCASSPVGEAHVASQMRAMQAVIGGEGSGGVIYPKLHYGRDAALAAALVLSHMARSACTLAELRQKHTDYTMCKSAHTLHKPVDMAKLAQALHKAFVHTAHINTEDGIKLRFSPGWVHIRTSNTEPILRIYSEAQSLHEAEGLQSTVRDFLQQFLG